MLTRNRRLCTAATKQLQFSTRTRVRTCRFCHFEILLNALLHKYSINNNNVEVIRCINRETRG